MLENDSSGIVIGAAIRIHRALGPGLTETAYEMILERDLLRAGLRVERQKRIDPVFEGMTLPNAFILDLVVNDHLIVELKATEKNSPAHARQLNTYLVLTGLPLGLVINFGMSTLKDGITRILNGGPERLRIPGVTV